MPGIKNIFSLADKFLRIAVAFEAPLHVERVLFARQRHLMNRAVARIAVDAFLDMNAVIEINEIRKIVDSGPFDGCIFSETLADRFEHRAVGPNLGMTRHTSLCGRKAGHRAFFDGGMTITAIDADSVDVVFVTERNRLIGGDIHLRHVG